jgi:hypothetical protein
MKTHFLNKRISEIICWATLLLALQPIYFSASKYQGWGGDYAGYLTETRNVVEGIPISSTKYIYNPDYPSLAPPAYPIGFPLLLAPIYKIWGLDILAFTKFMSLLWWIAGVLVFLLLKRHFSSWVSLLTAIGFIFQPLLFFGKNAIMSDSAFTVFWLATIYVYLSPNPTHLRKAIIIGFLAGFAWLVRSIGFVLPIILILHYLLERYKYSDLVSKGEGQWKYAVILLGLPILMQVLAHGLFFKMPSSGSYFDQLNLSNIWQVIRENITGYVRALLDFFQLNGDLWYIYRYKNNDVAAAIGGAIALGFIISGLMTKSNRSERLFKISIAVYGLIVLAWPSFQGLRLLLPIIPLLLYFLLKAIDQMETTSLFGAVSKWCLIPLLFVGEYYRIDKHIYTNVQVDEVGAPEWKDNQEAYEYAKLKTPPSSIFAYHHPLIFGLYADKASVRWSKHGSPQQISESFNHFNVDYLLLNNWLTETDQTIKDFLKENANQLDTIWHNERNVLYKLKQ